MYHKIIFFTHKQLLRLRQENLVCNFGKLLSLLLLAFTLCCPSLAVFAQTPAPKKPVIGISWKGPTQNYAAFKQLIELAGGTPVELKQVTSKDVPYTKDSTVAPQALEPSGALALPYAAKIKHRSYKHTNVAQVLQGVDGVFFTGGDDISPTLYARPAQVDNNGERIGATRDISDYTLMAYCHDKNIPVLAVCRGSQVMGIVSGSTFIQDIGKYYASQGAAYHDTHRMPKNAPHRNFARHDVELTSSTSHLAAIVGGPTLAQVSSWHHQAIGSLKGTDLVQTSRTVADGVEIVEGVECPHKTFYVGVQFHPENDCRLALLEGKSTPCNADICFNFFKQLVKYAAKTAK